MNRTTSSTPGQAYVFGFLRERAARYAWSWETGTASPPQPETAVVPVVSRQRFVFGFLRPRPAGPAPQPVQKKTSSAAEAALADTVSRQPEVAAPQQAPEPVAPAAVDFLVRIRAGLGKTRVALVQGLDELFGASKIDEDLLEELETHLLMADVGVEATSRIVDAVRARCLEGQGELREVLAAQLHDILQPVESPLQCEGHKPYVVLVVGVNGVGKTTTIGKLSRYLQLQGKSVLLAAGDTFRAAAVEQLQTWGERNDVPVIAQGSGADSASVIFDAVQSAQAREVDVVIADTAGRLHNKDNLMHELEKVVRVMRKLDETAPHEVLLVLDAGTGQNALTQARTFQEAVQVSGLAMTKLDGTAKGGVLFAVAHHLGIPIRFIGVGEGIDDLRPFRAGEFVDALLETPEQVA